MSRTEWESKKGSLLHAGAAVVCHPMHFEGSTETLGDDTDGSSYSERDREDHDGFFEPWSREKLGISSDDKLEITVGFLAVNYTPDKTFFLPDNLLNSWNITEDKILNWANTWWTRGKKEFPRYIPRFIPYTKPKDLSNQQLIADIKKNCQLVVELTEQVGSVTGRFGFSVFDEERTQLTLNLKDRKEEYRRHTVVHEFGHILGLKHEHQRSDFWQGIYRFTDFNAIGGEQFSERKETKGVYDDYTTYDSLSVMHYFWRLEYFKKQYRQWFEPQSTTGKLEIAKKRLNLEISATEEMVLMSMCDQLHKVKTLKYFIESKGVSNNEWVMATQLEPRNKDVPLPRKPEDIPEKGFKAWIKLVSGQLKPVTIRKVENVAGSTDSGSDHINDAYKFPVKPSTKDIKLINWAYNTSENKPPRPYSLPKPPPPVILPVQPSNNARENHFKVYLEPFDRSYGELGKFKVVMISGHPVKHNLVPTEMHIKEREMSSVVHTGDARRLLTRKEIIICINPSMQLDEEDCYYVFVRLYTPNGKVFRDSATIPLFKLTSVGKARVCYENLKKRAKSEIDVALSAPQAIESKNQGREQLKKQVLVVLKRDVDLPEKYMEKYDFGPRNDKFVLQLVKAMEFLFLFRGRNDLPFQFISNIGMISSDLKSDIALYKAACEAERLKAVEVAYEKYHNVEDNNGDPTHFWRFHCDETFMKAIPTGYSKVRVWIEFNKKQYLFERLLKLGRTLSRGKQFYTHEMYTSDQEASNLHIVFLLPLMEDKDLKKVFRDKNFINEIGNEIMEAVQISSENTETLIYSYKTQPDAARYRKRAQKVSVDPERERMLSLLSSVKKHSLGKPRVSRVRADSGMESPMDLVLKYAPNWKAVAKDLGFSDKRIERIESDYVEPERCLHVTIWKWLHNNKWKKDDKIPQPTVDNLKRVMESTSTV